VRWLMHWELYSQFFLTSCSGYMGLRISDIQGKGWRESFVAPIFNDDA
jgi:hypothetical protein